jgi:aryl-alcohol dehydrogenase-like predicted oxidoreductase
MTPILSLGTAQLGGDYGIASRRDDLSESSASSLLTTARANGITHLDTAIAYGDSELLLGRSGVRDFWVTTKIPQLPERNPKPHEWIERQLVASLERLQLEQVDAVLIHAAKDLLTGGGDVVAESLLSLKTSGLTRKVGFSAYSATEASAIIERYPMDVVQLPASFVDRSAAESGAIANFAARGVEVEIRSIFLQGLLLMNLCEQVTRFPAASALWEELAQWQREVGLTMLEVCVRYAMSIAGVSRVIVGVDSPQQLREIVAATYSGPVPAPNHLCSVDPLLVDPRNWPAI